LRQDGFFVAADDIDAAQCMLGLFWGSHLGQVGQHWYQTPVDIRQTLKTNDATSGQLSDTVFFKLSYTQQFSAVKQHKIPFAYQSSITQVNHVCIIKIFIFVYFASDCNSNFLCLQRANKYS